MTSKLHTWMLGTKSDVATRLLGFLMWLKLGEHLKLTMTGVLQAPDLTIST